MTRFSIGGEISRLGKADKRYDLLYKEAGLELGYGRAGSYKGHSHLCFVDVLFAPDGIRWDGMDGSEPPTLVIAPPRTYLPDVTVGDFVFVKFCPDARLVVLPDKVDDRLSEQDLLVFRRDASVEFPWYHSDTSVGSITFVLSDNELTLICSGQTPLTFGP